MISVIIPTLNEEETIGEVVGQMPKEVDGEAVEVIVVDGLSTDSTAEVARKANARVLLHKEKGKARAVKKGVRESKGDKLIFMDGDGTYPVNAIPKFVKALQNHDLVIGDVTKHLKSVKNNDMKSFLHSMAYKTYSVMFRMKRIKLEDPLDGMRAIRKKDFLRLKLESDGFELETEMNLKARDLGYSIKEVPIEYKSRSKGNSKFLFNLMDQIKIMKMMFFD